MMKKKVLLKRIRFLEEQIRIYYIANYNAKKHITGLVGPGVCAISIMEGNEEVPQVYDVEGLKEIINDLPLHDCGC